MSSKMSTMLRRRIPATIPITTSSTLNAFTKSRILSTDARSERTQEENSMSTSLSQGARSHRGTSRSKRSNFTSGTAAARLAIALLVGATVGCGKSEPVEATSDSTAAMVLGTRDVMTVTNEVIASGITITGSLNAAQEIDVKSQIAGQIDRVTVNRGTAVRRGQLLATIDARGTRAQAASADAALQAADRDLRAADTLYKAGAISERDFVQAKVARDAASAQLAQTRETLGRASVTSPISGVISDRMIEPGEAVQTATSLFTVVNTDSLELAGRVAPGDIAGVRIGQSVKLTLDAYSGRAVTGRVARIEPVAETGTRQVAVYVHVSNARHELVGGLFATGLILRQGSETPMPAVPRTAVRADGNASVAYVIEGDQLVKRTVTLGGEDANRGLVEIRSGVKAGERVLVNAPETALATTRIRILSDSSASRPVVADTSGRGSRGGE